MLQANSPTPLHVQLCNQLRRAIDNKELITGSRLPSERRLAAEHGITRRTARRAIRMLQLEGYVQVRHRQGYFVAQ